MDIGYLGTTDALLLLKLEIARSMGSFRAAIISRIIYQNAKLNDFSDLSACCSLRLSIPFPSKYSATAAECF